MALSKNSRLVESILFLENEFMTLRTISQMSGLPEEEVKVCLDEIAQEFRNNSHGLSLVEKSEAWSFLPCKDLHDRLRLCYGKKVDKRLSRAAMETLSIIAYSQPITRAEVSNIRGTLSDTVITLLLEQDYIKVVGRRDVRGYPRLYGTTKKFLSTFNLSSIQDLPQLSEVDRLRFEKEAGSDES